MSMNEAGLNYEVFYGNAQNVIEIIVAVTHRPFTVVKGLFTSGNSQIVCDRHFPG